MAIKIKTKITRKMIEAAEKALIDNGIEEDEAPTVLQAIGYILLDTELYLYQKEDDTRLKTVTDIVWETDGEKVDLPDTVDVPAIIEDEAVADYLSDIYGWCISSLRIKTA